LTQQTNSPWDGAVKLTVADPPAQDYGLHLRVPSWSGAPEFKLNGKPLQPQVEEGYAVFRRRWTNGDVIEANFPMKAHLLEANPNVLEDRGRVALSRGPFIYCFEGADNQVDLDRIILPRTAQFQSRYDARLNGVDVLSTEAVVSGAPAWAGDLYRPVKPAQQQSAATVEAVPYCVWNNRGAGKMAVWVEASH
jgi:DUF1680 family protein